MPHPTKNYKKGDILEGTNRSKKAARHYIVFLEPYNSGNFAGGMLTHNDKYTNNVSMKEEHFKRTDDNGSEFIFKFDRTHIVKGRFIKLENWGPFTKIG